MARHLIVCCDGTWNTSEQPSVTNVFRIYRALADKDSHGNHQLTHYQPGVGARGGPMAWLRGGISGHGLRADIKNAYRWLTTTYEPSDRIWLFGFSRGAYTVRSLAGMVAACGLIDTYNYRDNDELIRRHIDQVYDLKYRKRDHPASSWRDCLAFSYDPDDTDEIPIHFIGVWDTVGALGIPDNLALLNLGDARERYTFHDTALNRHIPHGRHAVAMDERRGPFTPTLWHTRTLGPDQTCRQIYFPGSHMDVGGGHRETGLSDGALAWMIGEAQQAAALDGAGLAFDPDMLDQIDPKVTDVLHDDTRASMRLLAPLYDPIIGPLLQPFFQARPRKVPKIDPQDRNADLHETVFDRYVAKMLTAAPYRPTRVLHSGIEATVTVAAQKPWNDTGLYLEPGNYTFEAKGEWFDARVGSGPSGTTGWRRFDLLTERGRLFGTALGAAEWIFRRRNAAANVLFTRRHEDLPWMALVAVVANEAGKKFRCNEVPPHQRIAVGGGAEAKVRAGGYLYAYANDAWGFYGNNHGSVRLTVKRTT